MWQKLAESKWGYLYSALSAVSSCILGIFLPTVWVLPFLNTLFVYPLYMQSVSSGKLKRAFLHMMVWTIFMSLTMLTLVNVAPERTGAHVLHGPAYRDEMLTWVRTGVGAESHPSQFIPIHLLHFSVFSILSLLTAGFAGLLFGAIQLNYMNFYVGNLIHDSHFAWQAIFMGWQIYAIVRVVGFITIAIALSHLFFVFVKKKKLNRELVNRYLIGGVSLVVLDILLKASLAPDWQKILQPILH
jgi:hypothetical protein